MRGKARKTVFMPGPKARTFNDQAGDVGYVPCGRVPLYPEHWGRDTDLSESVQFQPLLGHLSGAVDGEYAQRGHILTTKETGGYWVRKCKKCAGIGRRKDNGCFAWYSGLRSKQRKHKKQRPRITEVIRGLCQPWYARRDSNPQPSEPESDALSNCATGANDVTTSHI